MKKIILVILLTFLGSQIASAGSYQRWIYWVSNPSHVSNALEMATIVSAINQGMVKPNAPCQVGGTTFRIPYPDLYLTYVCLCVRISDPSAQTINDVIRDIQGGEAVQWGNDISHTVKNYWVKTNGEVTWTPNYSGAELGVWVLLINSIPTIKLDCGNPLELEGGPIVTNPLPVNPNPYSLPNNPTPAPCNNCGTTNNITVNVSCNGCQQSQQQQQQQEIVEYRAPTVYRDISSPEVITYQSPRVYIGGGYNGGYSQPNRYCAPRVEQNCNRPERNEYHAPRERTQTGGPGGAGMIGSGNAGGAGMIRSSGGGPGGSGTGGSGNPGGAGMARRR